MILSVERRTQAQAQAAAKRKHKAKTARAREGTERGGGRTGKATDRLYKHCLENMSGAQSDNFAWECLFYFFTAVVRLGFERGDL